jgi:hypothetical protein
VLGLVVWVVPAWVIRCWAAPMGKTVAKGSLSFFFFEQCLEAGGFLGFDLVGSGEAWDGGQ